MTSPIREPSAFGTASREEAETSPTIASGEVSQHETQFLETPGPAAHTTTPAVTEADGVSRPQSSETGLPSTDDFSEEEPTSAPARAQERIIAGDTRIDIRVEYGGGQIIGQWFEAVQRHSGAELRKDWVDRELKDYVPIGDEAELAGLLRETHVLVLYADQPGSGRWTAALRLLSTLAGPPLTIRRIRRESGDSFTMTGLRGSRGTGWILDLRDPDESMPAKADFDHELLQNGDLRADGSYLVVLVSAELWERIGNSATALARKLQPPESMKLLSAFLKSSYIAFPEDWAAKFAERVKPLSPAQIREWAQALASSHGEFESKNNRPPSPESPDDVQEIEKTVRNAVSSWMEVLANWHGEPNRKSYDRNYLLLAAVYDGAPIDGVHRQVASLAEALGETGQQAKPLEGQQGPGLVQLARQINAELLPNGRLRFPGPGFAEAVVRYFWLDRPNLIDRFMKWTVQLSVGLKHPEGSQLAERMAPWVLHQTQATGSTRLMRLVANAWSEDKNLAGNAHDLLVITSLDQQVGGRVRKAIGAWVNQDGSSAALLQTLADVFATLTPAHEQMLGRLGDLARSDKAGVSSAVGKAIHDLWSNEEFHLRLRDTLVSWFGSEQEPLQQAAASAFLHLALQRDTDEYPILLRGLQSPDWVIRGWRVVLGERVPEPLTYRAFMAWLDTASTVEVAMEPIFATLVSAVHDTPTDDLRGQRFLNLGRLGEHWVLQSNVLDEQERNKIFHELEHRTQLADPYRPIARYEEESSVA